jgi:signal transduction histidine kinase
LRPDDDAHSRDEALEISRRQLQLFADAVSHDLRAPLRSIESFSARLAERSSTALDDTSRDYLERIRAAAGRMSGLLEALGDLSYATRAELKREPVDISMLADWAIAELQDAEPGRSSDIRVQPGLRGYGDERLLKLLLGQLLGNAWKFSRDGAQVRIEVSGRSGEDGLDFSVRDAGCGFDARYAHKLFEPFQRLHGPDQGGGHGLGLAIAHRIVERHRGTLRGESGAEGGACFHVHLPAAPA